MDRIITEDGFILRGGDRAYNYYDMMPGRMPEAGRRFNWSDQRRDDSVPFDFKKDVWINFRHDDGSTALLNGERICSVEHAKKMGWPNPDGLWIEDVNHPPHKLRVGTKVLVDPDGDIGIIQGISGTNVAVQLESGTDQDWPVIVAQYEVGIHPDETNNEQ